jgi:hypothetical protein
MAAQLYQVTRVHIYRQGFEPSPTQRPILPYTHTTHGLRIQDSLTIGMTKIILFNVIMDVQKREAPDVLFLSETKHDTKWMEWWRWKLEMPNMVARDSDGASGGLALLWRNGIDLTVKSLSKYHIDAVIKGEDGISWWFTWIYGESKNDEKEKTWEIMRELKGKMDLPWMMCGNFNEILFGYEKDGGGGALRSERCMEKFKQALEDCSLHDLGFVGDVFT